MNEGGCTVFYNHLWFYGGLFSDETQVNLSPFTPVMGSCETLTPEPTGATFSTVSENLSNLRLGPLNRLSSLYSDDVSLGR